MASLPKRLSLLGAVAGAPALAVLVAGRACDASPAGVARVRAGRVVEASLRRTGMADSETRALVGRGTDAPLSRVAPEALFWRFRMYADVGVLSAALRYEGAVSSTDVLPQIATCARGCEQALKHELRALGIERSQALRGAVGYEAPVQALADVNVFSRVASRALWVLERFDADREAALVERLSEVRFEDYFEERTTFAVEAHLRDAPWDHTLFAAQRVKDVIVDRLRDHRGFRPNVDVKRPHVRFVLHWEKTSVTFSFDTSGAPLHKRGYRVEGGEAPMKENLAAAVLAMGHADVKRPFLDPFCGAGTLAIEQALRALRRAPGAERRFAIDRWKRAPVELKEALARARERAADEALTELPAPIELSDVDKEAVDRAREAVDRAGLAAHLLPRRADARTVEMPGERPVVVGNLPFGERLGGDDLRALRDLYREFGARMRTVDGARLLVFSAFDDAERALGLGKPEKQWALYSGPLKTMLRRFEL